MSTCWTTERWDDAKVRGYGPQYYSQRGEVCPPRLDSNVREYVADGEEYAYIFTREGVWNCIDRHEFDDKDPETVSIPSGRLVC